MSLVFGENLATGLLERGRNFSVSVAEAVQQRTGSLRRNFPSFRLLATIDYLDSLQSN